MGDFDASRFSLWRGMVSVMLTILLAGGGWLWVNLNGQVSALQTLTHANAVAIAGLIEAQTGNQKLRDELVTRFESISHGRATDLTEIRALQAENVEAIQGLLIRITKLELQMERAGQ